MPVARPPRLLLIGWDSADWKLILPLLESGAMPNLKRLMEQGTHGPLHTLQPILSPMLWTSIATGKYAWKHGVHGFVEPVPDGNGMRPISGLSRKCKAIWNILNQTGHRCNVVGWWPSHPAEPLDGVMLSNHYHPMRTPPGISNPIPKDAVHPARLIPALEKLRLHPSELGEEHLLPFVPHAQKIDQEKDSRLISLAKLISDALNIHAAATMLIQHEPSDFMAVYFDAIDHFCHTFMRYHPPRRDWIDENDFRLYSGVVEGAYRLHDLMLGTMMAMAGEECAILLLSDHGFHSDHLRPRSLSNQPTAPAAEHSQHGIFVLRAPGVRRGRRMAGATLLDIAPTILHFFDQPVGHDMDGRVLAEIFESPAKPRFIDSWETTDGPHGDGRHSPGLRHESTPGDAAALEQLAALGYIESPGDDIRQTSQEIRDELNYNLAQAYLGGGHAGKALSLLEMLWERHPNAHHFGVGALHCHLAMGHPEAARKILEIVKHRKAEDAAVAAPHLEALKVSIRESGNEPDDRQRETLRNLQFRAQTNAGNLLLLETRLLQAEGKFREALDLLSAMRAEIPDLPLLRGELHLGLGEEDAADEAFRQTLRLDPQSAAALHGLAETHLRRRRFQEAAGFALAATELQPHLPAAHFLLGIALHRLGQVELAEKAFRMTLRHSPQHVRAHRRLALLYTFRLKNPELAAFHRDAAVAARKRMLEMQSERGLRSLSPSEYPDLPPAPVRPPPRNIFAKTPAEEIITVVSGLPRSGTSLLMQMLALGGIAPLTDGERAADENNLRGYFEYEKVKRLAQESSWIDEAKGRAIKVIAHLLPHLPKTHRYQVIFVERDIEEILHSQEAMLRQLQKTPAADNDLLRPTYLRQLARITTWLDKQSHMDTLYVRHADVLNAPRKEAQHIHDFLAGKPAIDPMAAAVDPRLYRQRQFKKNP